jgi:methylenetetrahydrofolate--tRNA-(uracil-5-)-methyltransferase
LFPPLTQALDVGEDGKRLRGPEKGLAKKRAVSRRALDDLAQWMDGAQHPVAAE